METERTTSTPSRERPQAGALGGRHDLRELRDPRTMRAMAHPVRLDLLEALALEGPLTATQAGELIGQTPTTCSFHLRQLQKYGFVEDCGRPGARERPWRLTEVGNAISDQTGDPETDRAAGELSKVLLDRYLGRVRSWFDHRDTYPPAWREATGATESILFVTAEELTGVVDEIRSVLFRYLDRVEDPSKRPPAAEPVQALVCSYLMRLPKED